MSARRDQIRELLRGARARIDPAQVGLRRHHKGRAGLRREEVAALAGISVKWYAWLEQGRDLNFSVGVLERVASTLRLSAEEKDYLLALISRRSTLRTGIEESAARDNARSLWFLPVPALVMTLRWDILGWNEQTARIFRDYGAIAPGLRNLLRIILTDRKYQADAENYVLICRKLLAEFRVDFSHCCDDPAFDELVDELKQTVPSFTRHWQHVEVSDGSRTFSVVNHQELGDLYFDRLSYIPKGSDYLRVLMFVPRDPRTAKIVASIMAIDDPPRFTPDIDRAGSMNVLRHPNRP